MGLGEFLPEDLIFPSMLFMILSGLLAAVLGLSLSNMHKGALLSSFIVVAFFSFQQFELVALFPLLPLLKFGHAEETLLFIYALLFCPLVFLIVRGTFNWRGESRSIDFQSITPVANLSSVLLCVMAAVPIALYEIPANLQARSIVESVLRKDQGVRLAASRNEPPDIYYFIVDAYANPHTLKEIYGYDPSDFHNFLKQKGFYIAEKSTANHDCSNLSIASSLNMIYLNFLEKHLGSESKKMTAQFRLIQKSRTAQLLRKQGYKLVNVASGFPATSSIHDATNLRMNTGNSMLPLFLGVSCLGPLDRHTNLIRDMIAHQRLYPFDNIEKITAIKGPKFVFCHAMILHPPFIFDEDGTRLPLPRDQSAQPYLKEPYLQQLKFTEKKMRELVERLTLASARPSIIIMQSDHGPYSTDRNDRTTYLNERMRIFNACRFPDGGYGALYESMTPVNTFRIIFNQFFNGNFPLLKDENFASFKKDQYMHFNNVTNSVTFTNSD